MALEFGPKLGLVVHADEGENWYTEQTRFLRALDALIQCTAISHTIGAPPVSPSDGDVYLLPDAVSGDWSTHSNKVARWSSKLGAWEFYAPKTGWLAWSNETSAFVKFVDGEGWVDFDAAVTPPEEEPDPLPRFQLGYIDAVLLSSGTVASVDDPSAAGSSAVGYKTNYTTFCYVEFEILTMPTEDMAIGIVAAAVKSGLASGAAWAGSWFPGGSYKAFHMTADGVYYKNGGDSASGAPFEAGDRVGIAIDFGDERAWILVNGVGVDGDPVAGTGGTVIGDINTPLPFVGFMGNDISMSVRIHPLEADQLHTPSGYSAWIPAGPP